MLDLYPDKEYMLTFTNEEIMQYLVEPVQQYRDIRIRISTYGMLKDKKRKAMQDRILSVILDGEKGEFSVMFYDHLIAIFIQNEEFMFFDDNVKRNIVSSETYQNVVYEGTLRDKTHEEILGLIYDVVMIVRGAKEISIEETVIEQVGVQYPKCKYDVKIKKENRMRRKIQLENIRFLID
ncbi:hypothetical protein [Anaerosporobacter sp.]|uniref:hypothetical protein n=1 Tax=Anaerosporobacter sp. TaxID=1872529 RepID=UPI00286F34F2|nr:hypothetical protein [Anaerosporobacter sp.]